MLVAEVESGVSIQSMPSPCEQNIKFLRRISWEAIIVAEAALETSKLQEIEQKWRKEKSLSAIKAGIVQLWKGNL
jgi:hypothetical protein